MHHLSRDILICGVYKRAFPPFWNFYGLLPILRVIGGSDDCRSSAACPCLVCAHLGNPHRSICWTGWQRPCDGHSGDAARSGVPESFGQKAAYARVSHALRRKETSMVDIILLIAGTAFF